MNFSWEILESSSHALSKIYKNILNIKEKNKPGEINKEFKDKFKKTIIDDFNTSEALAIFHTMLKSNLSDADKLATAYDFDKLLGLGIKEYNKEEIKLSEEIKNILNERKIAREEKNWQKSDELRDTLSKKGFKVSDINGEQKIEKI
jgi:cysteinyl-tRNA synthetase